MAHFRSQRPGFLQGLANQTILLHLIHFWECQRDVPLRHPSTSSI
jgi:hypothetical protein